MQDRIRLYLFMGIFTGISVSGGVLENKTHIYRLIPLNFI